jgi:zinc transport system ATP-binding protein
MRSNLKKVSVENFAIIQAKSLSFSYGSNQILSDLNFSIYAGEYIGLIGPNGGGKTTLIKLILGLETPQRGQISINGKPVSDFKNWTQVGFVPQKILQSAISFPATVKEIVESGLNVHKKPWQGLSPNDTKAIQKALEISDILHLQNRLIEELSGGERQRVFLARSLVTQPKILILDEPTVGVDAQTQDKFYDFLKHLNQNHKMTIIFVSHDLPVVAKQTSRVLCLNQQLIQHNSPGDILQEGFMENLYGKNFKFISHHHAS